MNYTINVFDIIITLIVSLVSLFIFMIKTAQEKIETRMLAIEIKDEKYLRKDFYDQQRKEDKELVAKFEKEIKEELRNINKEVNCLPEKIIKLLDQRK